MPLNASLAIRMTAGSLAAISPATSSAASRSCSRGTTRSTDPNCFSSAAVAVAAVYIIARALGCGTSRDRWVAAPSAPRSTSGSPNVASSLATIMSALPARPMPPPRQNPCTAAITGTAHSYTAANAAKQPRLAPISACGPPALISLMSTPALNPRPSARRTTTRVLGSSPSSRTTLARSNQPRTGSAFTGGWLRMTSAIPVASVLISITSHHPRSWVLTAHGQDLPGHVRRVLAGQEHDHVGDLPRFGGPAERLPFCQGGEQLGGGHLGQMLMH